jgi:hypothetical protein
MNLVGKLHPEYAGEGGLLSRQGIFVFRRRGERLLGLQDGKECGKMASSIGKREAIP